MESGASNNEDVGMPLGSSRSRKGGTPRLLAYHLTILALAGISVYASYLPPCTSALYNNQFGGVGSATVEFMRAVVLCLLSMIAHAVLWSEASTLWLAGTSMIRSLWWPGACGKQVARGLVLALALVLAYIAYASVRLHGLATGPSNFFSEALRPYSVYAGYAVCMDIGLGFLFAVLLIRSIRKDIQQSINYERSLQKDSDRVQQDPTRVLTDHLLHDMAHFLAFRIHRIRAAGKYMWLVVLFVSYFLFEFGTSAFENLTPASREMVKMSLWLLTLGAIGGVAYLVVRYSALTDRMLRVLQSFEDEARKTRNYSLLYRIAQEKYALTDSLSPFNFLVTMLKSFGLLSLLGLAATWVMGAIIRAGTAEAAIRFVFPGVLAEPLTRLWRLLFPS